MKIFRIIVFVVVPTVFLFLMWRVYCFASFCPNLTPEGKTRSAQIYLLRSVSAYYDDHNQLPDLEEFKRSNKIADGWNKPMKIFFDYSTRRVTIISEGVSRQPLVTSDIFPLKKD